MRIRSFAAPALLVLFGVAWAPQQDFHWRGALDAGQRVTIKGINGNIRAEAASGSEVEITAVKRAGRRGDVDDVRIERVMHAGGVTVCAIYPSPRGGMRNECTAGTDSRVNNENNDVRVDFVVRVPRGVHFYGGTVNGSVSAEDMPADASVSTVNGAATVSAAGVVQASTVNGDVEATTGQANPARDLRFSTVNGSITLNVPAGFRATVDAELLNGRIDSDFPLRITSGRYVGRSAEGEIGGGGRELNLSTVNGNIRIRRSGGR